MNPMEKKLNTIIEQNEQLIKVFATLIRTLEAKGAFTRQDFSKCAAFGKSLNLDQLLFGLDKK